MAKSRQSGDKDRNLWDRFMLWVEENQKVLWVVLLVILAPTFAMTGLWTPQRSADDVPRDQIFGTVISDADVRRAHREIGWVQSVVRLASSADFSLPAAFRDSGDSWGQLSAPQYFAYLKEAADRGISVSDAELGECVRELWQRLAAVERAEKAMESVPPPVGNDQNAAFQRQFQQLEQSRKALEELRGGDGRAFDAAGWADYVQRFEPGGKSGRRGSVSELESALRNLATIAKLESYVKGGVQVSPQEIFEEYRKEKQSRKLSWTELKAPADEVAKVAAALTLDDLRKHYEAERQNQRGNPFRKATSVRTSWLLLPKEHFAAEAEKGLTEDDISKYYKENRNEFRRPTILAEEGTFALRSAAEKQAFEEKLFQPLAGIKEKVREKVLEQKTRTGMQDLARSLTARLFPTKPAGSTGPDPTGASFEELVKDFPFLRTGTTGYATRDEVKAALGDAYTNTVEGWFRSAEGRTPISPPRFAVSGDKGQVFYNRIETRPANALPTFEEIEAGVRSHLAKRRVLDALEAAAKAAAAEINEGKKDLAAAQAAGIDVEIAGSKAHVAASPVQSTPSFIGRDETIRVPRQEPEKKDPAAADPEDAEDPEDDLEPHPASGTLVEAVFNLPDTDQGKVSQTSDDKVGSVFLFRLDDLKLPNPGKFEESKSYLESRLRREREQSAFTKWRDDLLRRARPQASTAAGEAPAEAPSPAAS